MAIIPLKQTVTILREGEPDRWGNSTRTEITLKCRIQEGAKLTRKTSAMSGANSISSEEVVSTARIMFDKFVDIRLTDEIIYVDEAGNSRTYLPLNISRTRGLNGKAILTTVEV
jgi:hypothetical protein